MPWWAVEESEPRRLGMTHPEYVAWRYHGEGAYLLPRFRLKWAVDDLAEKQELEKLHKDGGKRHVLDDGTPWRDAAPRVRYERDAEGVYHLLA